MHTLTSDPSAEDCSSSNFQEPTRRPRPVPPPVPSSPPSSSLAASSHLTPHNQPHSRRQQSNVVLPVVRKTHQHLRTTGSTAHAKLQRRGPGPSATVGSASVSTGSQGDDNADPSKTAPLVSIPASGDCSKVPENGNVAEGVGEQQASDNRQLSSVSDEKTRRYNRITMIIIYGREALCILALILTTYATIQNSPPKVSKAPPPVPFFSEDSLVYDWPTGALGATQTRVSVSELSFVLYYAPWCAESRFARHAYDQVAGLFFREAHFAAINCWQPGGECRQRYTKVQSWPVLMAYQPSGLAVQYHQTWTTAALSRFVQSLMLPLHRFSSPGDLMDHMTGKDAVVVAFLDVMHESKLYQRYYQASLKWLEKDPFQEVSFGIVTGQSSNMFGVETVPSIRLYLWNETIEYVGNTSWSPHELISWIYKQLHVVSMWIAPPGNVKSKTIDPFFQQGPVLMLFTPRPLYDDGSDAYMMLRQLSMQYYNCPGDAWILEMAREYIAEQRLVNAAQYVEKRKRCVQILGGHSSQEEDDSTEGRRYGRHGCKDDFKSTVSVSFVNVLNSSKFVDGKPVGGKPSSEEYCDIAPAMGCGKRECGTIGPGVRRSSHLMWQSEACVSSQSDNGPEASYEPARPKTSMLDWEYDYRGPKMLTKIFQHRQCELMLLAEAQKTNVFFIEPPRQDPPALDYYAMIGGVSCKHNKTLTFLSMDSNTYHAFSERLGVDVLNEPNRTVAFIIDHADESAYVLRDNINLHTLAKFVHDYYNRSLQRYLRSGDIPYEHTHSFDAEELKRQDQKNLVKHRELVEAAEAKAKAEELKKRKQQTATATSDLPKTVSPVPEQASVQEKPTPVRAPRVYHAVKEIYSSNFERTVLESNRTVVVSFYSAQCAFCYLLSHHMLTVSHMLRHQPGLWFVRIDGELNDLPWQYTMDVFPSLIIFPNGRKSESRIFPQTSKINVPNLIWFILSNLSPAERLHANFLLCSDVNAASRDNCLLMLKRELSSSIQLSLLEWRQQKSDTYERRDRIVRRLQLLKQSYLDTLRCLSHSCDLTELVNARKRILELWMGSHRHRVGL
ncbi:uncharacterized protein LOC128724072 [Anopheles nili]|uniref:uncharacterized protein LOC128724072 n=1 Tax=Anopheles nili TaxID=185578 RepID=UPI00237B90DB|nr:uncharacterized protein LOC128724072 [Anopheles nili]